MPTLDHTREAEIMKTFERGQRLYGLTNSQGYQDLLDILEAEIDLYEYRLLNLPPGTDDLLLRDTLGHARVARSIFEQLQIKINTYIEMGQTAVAATEQMIANSADYSNL